MGRSIEEIVVCLVALKRLAGSIRLGIIRFDRLGHRIDQLCWNLVPIVMFIRERCSGALDRLAQYWLP